MTSSSIVDALQDEHWSKEPTTAVIYFYFAKYDLRRATDESLFSSMLFQLCCQLHAVPIELGVIGALANDKKLQFEQLFRAFAIAVRKFPQIFIIVDAVDECSNARRLIATLQSIIDWELDGLHIFFSARPHLFMREHLKRSHQSHHLRYFSTTDGNHQDILSLITARVSEQLSFLPWGTKQDVIREVAAKAEGS